MISVTQVIYKKVEGRLCVLPQGHTGDDSLNPPVLPSLAFVAANSPSSPVYIPFSAIAKLQSSVSGSKVCLFKFDILPSYNASTPSSPPLPANFIFNFTGDKAEGNREVVKRALPSFPYVEPPAAESSQAKSKDDASKTQTSEAQPVETLNKTRGAKTNLPASSRASSASTMTQSAIEASVLESSVQTPKKTRDARIERLRKEETLRNAYFDLVVSSPHIFRDDEFWSTYAWDTAQNSDELATTEGSTDATSSSGASGATASASVSTNASSSPTKQTSTGPVQVFAQEQAKSIETELVAGKGFLELLSSNFIDGRLKLVLTPALRKQIYEEFPLVRMAYQSRVPSTMTPSSFWDAFFRAQLAKMMRKKTEAKEEAEARERERRNKNKSRSKAKKTSTVAATVSTTQKTTLSKEEVETQFFEKLTEATPRQLNSLVWQSRASDAITQDPSKSSSRSSLMPMLAEDNVIPTATDAPTAIANSLSSTAIASDPTELSSETHFTNDTSNTRGASTAHSAVEAPRNSTNNTSTAQPFLAPGPLSQQQNLLSQRIAQLSRGSTSSSKDLAPSTSGSTPSSSSVPSSGVITAEEMLFSALQEQTQLEAAGRQRPKGQSAGTQAVLNAWYGGVSGEGLTGSKVGEGVGALSDAIEVLDGIVVEAGELDDSSWSELKREKERRNRHLQLIRKFNRHGHIVVSSTSHLEANEMEERKYNDYAPSAAISDEQKLENKSMAYVKTEFGSDTAIEERHAREKELQSETSISVTSLMDVDRQVGLSGEVEGHRKGDATLQPKQMTAFRYPRVPQFRDPTPPSEPNPSSIVQIMSDLNSWSKSSISRQKRPSQSNKASGSLYPASNASDMDIDVVDVEKLLEKVDQWKRHFWNMMERASVLQKNEGDAFSFVGAEKLPAIVLKLQEFLELMKEMRELVIQSRWTSEPAKNILVRLTRQEESVSKCLLVYEQIQP